MKEAYANTGIPATRNWRAWATQFSTGAYNSATHGGRYVQNYSNTVASRVYGNFEELDEMPRSSVLIKDSFSANANGTLAVGPLFIMEKMGNGFSADTADWRYYMFTPDGSLFGVTGGKNSAGMTFCHECHTAGMDADYMLFMPDEYRAK